MFADIHEFKKYVGGGANVSLEMESIEPTIDDTLNLHLAPWLGEQLLEDIQAAIDAGNIPQSFQDLLEHLHPALAKLTMHEYSKIGAIQFSESGAHRVVTENMQSAYKYQETAYSNQMLTMGYEAIEKMLKFLEKNEADYPAWTSSTAYTKHRSYFVRYASQMRDHYGQSITRYAYEMIRPIIEEVECFAIESTMSAGIFSHLKDKAIAADGTTEEKKAIYMIEKAIVHFAVKEGLQRHWLQMDGQRIVHRTDKDDDRRSQYTQASAQAVEFARRGHELWGNRWVRKYMDYIVNNENAFPLAFCGTDEFWADDAVYWTNSTSSNWAISGSGSTNPRCYATAAQIEEAKGESGDGCCEVECPDRPTGCGCGSGMSFDSCGCGCSGKSSKVVRF